MSCLAGNAQSALNQRTSLHRSGKRCMPSMPRACPPSLFAAGSRQAAQQGRSASETRRLRASSSAKAEAPAAPVTVGVAETGSHSQRGTVRKQNEDRLVAEVTAAAGPGMPFGYAAVFDGHGGWATAEWLQNELLGYIEGAWQGGNAPEAAADKEVLRPKGGLMSMMGERGIGGAKCGSTAAVALLYASPSGAGTTLLTANVGDARVLLVRGSQVLQLTEDHVPDQEEERIRIERQNPSKNLALVRYVGGTWRVGGILALSRAFGDAYLKGTGQFEGVSAGSDGYSSGFGVIAEPYTQVTQLTADDRWLVISSDGLFANEERGGGGGLSNAEAGALCDKLAGSGCSAIAKALAEAAVKAGTTDDVTVVVLRLK
eukprot:scaffold12.g8227.t1